jgi:hypothetical protein
MSTPNLAALLVFVLPELVRLIMPLMRPLMRLLMLLLPFARLELALILVIFRKEATLLKDFQQDMVDLLGKL